MVENVSSFEGYPSARLYFLSNCPRILKLILIHLKFPALPFPVHGKVSDLPQLNQLLTLVLLQTCVAGSSFSSPPLDRRTGFPE